MKQKKLLNKYKHKYIYICFYFAIKNNNGLVNNFYMPIF